jgi:hypothetical protein
MLRSRIEMAAGKRDSATQTKAVVCSSRSAVPGQHHVINLVRQQQWKIDIGSCAFFGCRIFITTVTVAV